MDIESTENLVVDAIADPPRNLNSNKPQSDTAEVNNEVLKNSNESEKEQPKSEKTKTKNSKSKKKIVNGINIINSSQVRIGTDIHNNFMSKSNSCAYEPPSMPNHNTVDIELRDIAKLLISNEKLEPKHLDLISGHVGDLWELLGTKLGYSRGQVQQFKINYGAFHIKEVIYKMLLDWTQAHPEKATVGNIIDTLWLCNLKEVVKIFSEHNFDE